VRSALLACVLVACSSSKSEGAADPVDSGASNEAIVADWATALCTRIFECTPGWSLRVYGGVDAASCARVYGDWMTRSLAAPGAPTKLPQMTTCTTELRALSCLDFHDVFLAFDYAAAPACATVDPGTRELGEGCVYSAQCKSGVCGAFEGTCGKCAPIAGEGEPCNPAVFPSCDTTKDLLCSSSGKCTKAPKRDEPCTRDCSGWNYCSELTSKCTPIISARGEACNLDSNNCDLYGHGLVCNNRTLTCDALEIAGEGQSCGLGIDSGGFAKCDVGLLCDMTTPTTPNSFSGKCVKARPGRLGESCVTIESPVNGNGCEWGLYCKDGKCVADDPVACK
jgi:hypothetical protein